MRPPRNAAIVVLTGAGISAESGLPTFRDARGLWREHRPEDLATPEAFARDPALVHAFYNHRRAQLDRVAPNAAHEALVRLEREWPSEVLVVTQNVDDLHERAGSRSLIHLHGELRKVRCTACGALRTQEGDCGVRTACPDCGREGTLRPHIVWFGERPLELDRVYQALSRCGAFLAIGTSGRVYPAAGFVTCVPPGAWTVEVNREPSEIAEAFREHQIGAATEAVPRLVAAWLELP